jgi:low affinity Fe/Cu permease
MSEEAGHRNGANLPSYENGQLSVFDRFTTIITFLLVALLQNTERRADDAVQQKLNAIAGALADLMQTDTGSNRQLANDRRELLAAVGLEDRESAG